MMVHEYCKHLVIANHVVSYEYFCNSLQDYELHWLLENQKFAYKNEWEQTRYKLYYAIAPFTKKKFDSIQEFFPLSTDDKKEEHHYEITNDEIEKMKREAKKMESQLRGG